MLWTATITPQFFRLLKEQKFRWPTERHGLLEVSTPNKQGGLNAVSLPQCNRKTMKHQITQTYTNRKIVFIYKIGCSRATFWICAFWDACTSKSSTLMPSTAMHALSKIIQMCSLHSDNQIPIGICHTPIPPVALPWIGVSQSPGSITVSLKIATISLCGTKSSKRLTWLV